MIKEIKQKNRELYKWANSLPIQDKAKNTNPYLVIPDDQYINAKFKVLVLGKETNGWGEGEGEDCTSPEDLENLYSEKVLEKQIWGCGNPFWDFYFEWVVRSIFDGTHLDIGVCASNVALLGLKYGNKGFNIKYVNELSGFLKDYLYILKPDAIICFTGFGTATRREINYLKILEPIFGTYSRGQDIFPLDRKWPMRKLSFASAEINGKKISIYGTRHPERTSRAWKESIGQSISQIVSSP